MPTTPIPQGQDGPPLSRWTLTWLAEGPPAARILVHRVWSALTELQRSGRHPDPDALSALLNQLLDHQPSPTGRCRTCPRRHSHHWWNWQHPHFPCSLWTTIDFRLHEPLRGNRWPAPSRVLPDDNGGSNSGHQG
jgi:hypothetical protein